MTKEWVARAIGAVVSTPVWVLLVAMLWDMRVVLPERDGALEAMEAGPASRSPPSPVTAKQIHWADFIATPSTRRVKAARS